MDEIQLILVDLDNVRGSHAGPLETAWASKLPLPPEANNDSLSCVVAFAMNLDTAGHHVSFEGLRVLAQHLAAAIARTTLHGIEIEIEIALTLVVKASADGSLPTNDAEKLRAWVAEAGPWRDAYLLVLRDLAGEEALVPRLDAERSISVAMGDAELEHAELIDLLPLPRLGPQAHREGRLTAGGTLWRVVDPGEHVAVAETNLPCGTERLL